MDLLKVPIYSAKILGGGPLWKVDEKTHSVYGLATAELPDSDGEVADYADSAANYTTWGEQTAQVTRSAGQAVSYGNIRWQHTTQIAGKVNKIDLFPDRKQIFLLTQPVDDDIWGQLVDGFLTGYSQAGKYQYRRCFECGYDMPAGSYCPQCRKKVWARYAPILSEVSYVDRPCLGQAVFQYVKSDGSTELRKFQGGTMTLKDHFTKEAAHQKQLAKTHRAVVDGGRQLARAIESHADANTIAKCIKAITDPFDAMVSAHAAHAGHLSEIAAEGLAGSGMVVEGNGLERVAKADDIVDQFFSKYMYPSAPVATVPGPEGGPFSPAAGVTRAAVDKLAEDRRDPRERLFKGL